MGLGEPTNSIQHIKGSEGSLAALTITVVISRQFIAASSVVPTPRQVRALADLLSIWHGHASTELLRRKLVPSATHTPNELRDAFIKCSRGNLPRSPIISPVSATRSQSYGAGGC